ncbi:MAG: hypothetical protein HFG81_12435 [Dorea sp.]|uniref:AbiH family protein n=1 Tax=Sporofaciens musculi TaxID=2681861 RepID=UPI0021746EAE|nr:AbiH family protein [Sporofaciens musculi]MCI9423497.1 hypothetical protein [Dorea sp.]
MAVFSNNDLENVMEEDGDIIILNMCVENMTAVGYDLAIGFICDSATGKIPETYPEDQDRYILLPRQRYLVISKEFLYLPPRCMATLHSRISHVLKGIIVPSTVIDPNYVGFVMGTLFNSTSKNIYIKKNNPFVTMVVHEFRTPTVKYLRKNDQNKPMNALATLYSKYPNIKKEARDAAIAYWTKAREEIEYEYEAAKELMYEKRQKKNALSSEDSQRIGVTFLIGNGFDINVGLKTRYTDFYRYYIPKKNDELSNEIEKDISKWSELELSLGRFTKELKDKKIFWKCEAALEECLLDYLDEVMKGINITSTEKREDIAHVIRYSLTDFYEEFPDEIKSYIKEILSDESKQKEYSFITFNYTDVLERCLETVEEFFIDWFFSAIKEVVHIHGTIKSKDIVLGVNDDGQIEDKEFKNNRLDRQRLIKEEIIEHNGNTNKKKAYKIIDSSSIICIFGMSIGVTDKVWWQYIAEWLQKDKNRRLIIFVKDEKVYQNKKFSNECENDTKNAFKYNGELTDRWKQIENQVYVKVNADIFNFKVV